MFSLSLLWVLIGLLVGGLARLARCDPAAWQRSGWLYMPVLGAVTALAAGWLGVVLLGNFFATMLALWLSILCVMVVPRSAYWLSMRLHIKIL